MYNGGYLISQINKLTGRKINELLRNAKVTEFNGAQGTILYTLWNKNEMSIKEISNYTGLAKTSLSSMLERMEKQNLIEKVNNNDDKRSTIIRLTDKARGLEEIYNNICKEMQFQYYRDFNEKEIKLFESMLEKVLKNLEEGR